MAKNTTVAGIDLTAKEIEAVKDLANVTQNTNGGEGWGFADEMKTPKRSRGGLVGSLSTKGLITVSVENNGGGQPDYTLFHFTDAGRAVLVALGCPLPGDEPTVIVLNISPADPIDGAAILAACGMAAPSTATAAEEVIEIPQDTEEPATTAAPVRTGKKARREAKRAEEAKATPAAPTVKPAPVRNATRKPAATPAPATVEPKEKATSGDKKDGLRKPQAKILQALKSAGRGLTRKEIVAATKLDNAWMTEWVGAADTDKRAKNDETKFKCLLTLGLVKAEVHDVDGKNQTQYSLTAAGRKAADKIS